MYSFSTSFWIVPVSGGRIDPLFLGHQLVQQQQHRSRGVDRHRRRHLAERDAVEQDAHVVDRVDRHAHLAHLAGGQHGVGVHPHLGRQVERHRQAGRTVRDQLQVARIGFRRRTEPGVLPHRPRTLGVHRGVDPAGVGELPRLAQLLVRVEAGQGLRSVDRGERSARFGVTTHLRIVAHRPAIDTRRRRTRSISEPRSAPVPPPNRASERSPAPSAVPARDRARSPAR